MNFAHKKFCPGVPSLHPAEICLETPCLTDKTIKHLLYFQTRLPKKSHFSSGLTVNFTSNIHFLWKDIITLPFTLISIVFITKSSELLEMTTINSFTYYICSLLKICMQKNKMTFSFFHKDRKREQRKAKRKLHVHILNGRLQGLS